MRKQRILRGIVITVFTAVLVFLMDIPQTIHRHKVSADRERMEYMTEPIENPWTPMIWEYYCLTEHRDPSVYNRYEEAAFLKWMKTDDYHSALVTLYASKDIPSIEDFNPKNTEK
jgi:hypothetical protein